ncbi:hypothetical protein AAMO2058_001234700 [Amorphochlora amoebiformis]
MGRSYGVRSFESFEEDVRLGGQGIDGVLAIHAVDYIASFIASKVPSYPRRHSAFGYIIFQQPKPGSRDPGISWRSDPGIPDARNNSPTPVDQAVVLRCCQCGKTERFDSTSIPSRCTSNIRTSLWKVPRVEGGLFEWEHMGCTCWVKLRSGMRKSHVSCRVSEEIVEVLDNVEDSKGSNDEMGQLILTNLRIMWLYKRDKKTNLSVGYDSIRKMAIQETNLKSVEPRNVLTISAKYNEGRFEFIFACSDRRAPSVFRVLASLQNSYSATRLFRDLKLRGSFVKNKKLLVLPGESIVRNVKGVWNLSAEQGNLGTFYITNVRVVWFAEMAENFNISIPYMQLTAMVIRKSKFGNALVMQTTTSSGNYTLGFRIDPFKLLEVVHQEMSTLFEVYSKKPNFGVKYKKSSEQHSRPPPANEDVQIVNDEQMEHFEALTRYYVDPGKGKDRNPVYNEHLGLAVEELKGSITVPKLWAIVV